MTPEIAVILYFCLFSAAAFWGYFITEMWMTYRNSKLHSQEKASAEFIKFIDMLQEEANNLREIANRPIPAKQQKPTEVHTFCWRHEGKLKEVKIVIDPNLDTVISGSPEEFAAMMKAASPDQLEAFMKRMNNEKETDTFVFSEQAALQMRLVGLSPDEVVVKVLKASGRMD